MDYKSLADGTVIFCCFNNHNKITSTIFSTWMRILARVPNSVLWLYVQNEIAQKNLSVEARRHGVSAERLVFASTIDHDAHLHRLSLASVFLDTHPYNAHTTASDSLRVGVPLITLRGVSFQSRVASSLLRAVDLPELITRDLSDYESLAVRLGSSKDELAALRFKVKSQVAKSVLFNPKQYTREFERHISKIVAKHRGAE
jgi:protein O-GlcNAc transferase